MTGKPFACPSPGASRSGRGRRAKRRSAWPIVPSHPGIREDILHALYLPFDRLRAGRTSSRRGRAASNAYYSYLLLAIPLLALALGCGDHGPPSGPDAVGPDAIGSDAIEIDAADLDAIEPLVDPSLEILEGGELRPPVGDYARGGYVVPSGFWRGWRVRDYGDCRPVPCIRFYNHGTYGAMGDHTQGVYYMGEETAYEGEVAMRIRFNEGTLGLPGGGQHLISVTSRPLIFTPQRVGLRNWTRVDFDNPRPGRIRAVVFNVVDGVPINERRWPTHWFNVPFAVNQWAQVEIGWRMSGNRLTINVNGQSHTFTLLTGSEAPGYYLALGNMDPIRDDIDFDDIIVRLTDTESSTAETIYQVP